MSRPRKNWRVLVLENCFLQGGGITSRRDGVTMRFHAQTKPLRGGEPEQIILELRLCGWGSIGSFVQDLRVAFGNWRRAEEAALASTARAIGKEE